MLMYYFPPNHFNCRTDVIRLRKGTPTEKYNLPQIPEAFKNNPAVSGKIFTDKHSYFLNAPDEVIALGKRLKEEVERIEKRRAEFEKLLANKDYLDVAFDEKTGGLKATHRLHSFDPNKGHYEKEARDLLFENGYKIVLEKELAEENEKVIDGIKRIDGFLNDLSCDISSILGSGKHTIKRAFQHSEGKNVKVAILYFPNKELFSVERVSSGLSDFNKYSNHTFEKIILVFKDGVVEYK